MVVHIGTYGPKLKQSQQIGEISVFQILWICSADARMRSLIIASMRTRRASTLESVDRITSKTGTQQGQIHMQDTERERDLSNPVHSIGGSFTSVADRAVRL
jgi:hypothetical protein